MALKAIDKKAILKHVDRQQKVDARQLLQTLRARLKDARELRRRKLADAVKRCKEQRRIIAEKMRILRTVLKDVKVERVQARATCATGLHEANHLRAMELEARKALEVESLSQRQLRLAERGNRQRAKEAPRISKRVLQSESDDEVRTNIPADLVPLFNRVRRIIRGSARMSRTEEFLKYAEEHPDEYLSSIDDKTEALVRELEERERRAAAAANEVPFYR